jgi:hypothetical protein
MAAGDPYNAWPECRWLSDDTVSNDLQIPPSAGETSPPPDRRFDNIELAEVEVWPNLPPSIEAEEVRNRTMTRLLRKAWPSLERC